MESKLSSNSTHLGHDILSYLIRNLNLHLLQVDFMLLVLVIHHTGMLCLQSSNVALMFQLHKQMPESTDTGGQQQTGCSACGAREE